MRVDEFDYYLPEDRIAQHPVTPRDASRLMVVNRSNGEIHHRVFRDIVEYLKAGDVLVVNDTRVIPARLYGERQDTGGQVEVLLLRDLGGGLWEALTRPGRRTRPGARVAFGGGEFLCTVEEAREDGTRVLRFSSADEVDRLVDKLGTMPTPPYIHEPLSDPERYQTVYSVHRGSAAAPTAGLHFTPELLQKVQDAGVEIARITLHVGLGTFRPVAAETVEEHRMHSEWYRVTGEAAEMINAARTAGARVVAVGTTSARTLESVADEDGRVRAVSGWTDIFIYPGYRFKAVDAMITNFHLPRSTLLMMVSAFAGKDLIMRAYETAVNMGYRFFSFGDAMLIL